jgi:hypothetical protein
MVCCNIRSSHIDVKAPGCNRWPEEQKITWQLVDVAGRSVIAKDAVLKKGENRITIDWNSLRTRTYFLQVRGQCVIAQEKIQKL